jgi:hypothetical protein
MIVIEFVVLSRAKVDEDWRALDDRIGLGTSQAGVTVARDFEAAETTRTDEELLENLIPPSAYKS